MTEKKRGFASMTPERQRELASKGGQAARDKGVLHKWTPETARIAGKKGGAIISQDRKHMSRIGTIGGIVAGKRRALKDSGAEFSGKDRGEKLQDQLRDDENRRLDEQA